MAATKNICVMLKSFCQSIYLYGSDIRIYQRPKIGTKYFKHDSYREIDK